MKMGYNRSPCRNDETFGFPKRDAIVAAPSRNHNAETQISAFVRRASRPITSSVDCQCRNGLDLHSKLLLSAVQIIPLL